MISMLSSVIVVAKLLKKDKKQVVSMKKDSSRGLYKQKRKLVEKLPLLRCLAESNRSTRFCRPLPNRSVKTPCSVATSFLISECKGTAFILFHQIFYQLFSIFFEFLS